MDKRLTYRVIIKVLFLFLLIVLAWIFLNSLFTHSDEKNEDETPLKIVELGVNGMKKGEVKKAQWEGKFVRVISLGGNQFFTYINIGDSGNCPLFKEESSLKDICTGTRFDFSGNEIGNEIHGSKLVSPPSTYKNGVLFIGMKSLKK